MPKPISAFSLKMIALIAMTVDHIGAVLFPEMLLFRFLGRMAMPVFCFIFAGSARKTRNRPLFLRRLFLFALVAQVPYMLAFSTWSGNVFFTFFLSLLFLMAIDGTVQGPAAAVLAISTAALVTLCDWGIIGLLFVLSFYFSENSFPKRVIFFSLSAAVMFLLLSDGRIYPHIGVFLPLPLFALYNGKRGRDLRFLFYGYYPAHLLLLYALSKILPRVLGDH